MDSEGVALACPGTDSEGAVLWRPLHSHQLGLAHWGTEGSGDNWDAAGGGARVEPVAGVGSGARIRSGA
jgi:hypothetical protein